MQIKAGDYNIYFNMKGGKTIYKYNKITQQKKFHLLTLVLQDRLLIKQAAKVVGINYSTAKTILFFNRNQSKSYQFDLQVTQSPATHNNKTYACIKAISDSEDLQRQTAPVSPIDIVSTIGSKIQTLSHSVLSKKSGDNNSNQQKLCSNESDNSNDRLEKMLSKEKSYQLFSENRPKTRSQLALLQKACALKSEETGRKESEACQWSEVENE